MAKRLFIGGVADEQYIEVNDTDRDRRIPIPPVFREYPKSVGVVKIREDRYVRRTLKMGTSARECVILEAFVIDTLDIGDTTFLTMLLRPNVATPRS